MSKNVQFKNSLKKKNLKKYARLFREYTIYTIVFTICINQKNFEASLSIANRSFFTSLNRKQDRQEKGWKKRSIMELRMFQWNQIRGGCISRHVTSLIFRPLVHNLFRPHSLLVPSYPRDSARFTFYSTVEATRVPNVAERGSPTETNSSWSIRDRPWKTLNTLRGNVGRKLTPMRVSRPKESNGNYEEEFLFWHRLNLINRLSFA